MEKTTHRIGDYIVKVNPLENSVSITIQENKDGKFGPSEVFQPSYEELEQMLERFEGNEERLFSYLIAQAKENITTKKKKTSMKEITKGISFSKMKTYALYACLGLFVIGIGFVVATFETKNQKIARLGEQILLLEGQIKSIRAERETEYASCQEKCIQDREPYDQKVLERLDEAKKIRQKIEEIRK